MIYDAFCFLNELEVLEIHLAELEDFVDVFVLVESTRTFQNNPKELIFANNKHRFERFLPKIRHIVVEDSPDTQDQWAVEYFQFECADRGMADLRPEDTILWGTVDEVASKTAVRRSMGRRGDPLMMMQHCLAGYLNCLHTGRWTGTRIITGQQWRASTRKYKDFRADWLEYTVPDGGWHFTSMGGVERIKQKIQSYGHKELNHPDFLNSIGQNLINCYTLTDRDGVRRSRVDLSFLPRCVAENKDRFAHLLIPETKITWKDIDGWFDFEDIYDAVIKEANREAVFVEVGCWQGKSAAYMGTLLRMAGLPIEFYCVDTWKGSATDKTDEIVRARGGDLFPTFRQNMRDAGVFEFVNPIQQESVRAAERFQDRSVDFVFIDADHQFDAVVADIRAWRPKVKAGGVIAGHDFGDGGVRTAVRQEFGAQAIQNGNSWVVRKEQS